MFTTRSCSSSDFVSSVRALNNYRANYRALARCAEELPQAGQSSNCDSANFLRCRNFLSGSAT
ncbi:hypothetical protein BCEP27_110062 [Burkholderia cepacia]